MQPTALRPPAKAIARRATIEAVPNQLSTDLTDAAVRPYFLWDEALTVAEFRARIAGGDADERARYVGKLMREARDRDVWSFIGPQSAWELLPQVERYVGRRRSFWRYLLEAWHRDGYVR
jgi:hypothetical protein